MDDQTIVQELLSKATSSLGYMKMITPKKFSEGQNGFTKIGEQPNSLSLSLLLFILHVVLSSIRGCDQAHQGRDQLDGQQHGPGLRQEAPCQPATGRLQGQRRRQGNILATGLSLSREVTSSLAYGDNSSVRNRNLSARFATIVYHIGILSLVSFQFKSISNI